MSRALPTTARLEAFSDGVIAVIITIMVLELKVPFADGFAGLRSILPSLGVYLLSFAFTGVYWVNHGHLMDRLRHVDTLVLWANLLFLFLLSLLPFFTEYLAQKHMNPFSVQLYAVSLLCTGFGFQALSAAVLRRTDRLHDGHTPVPAEAAQHLTEIRNGWISAGVYLLALAVARWHPHLALLLIAIVTLLWIVPGMATRQNIQCPSPDPETP